MISCFLLVTEHVAPESVVQLDFLCFAVRPLPISNATFVALGGRVASTISLVLAVLRFRTIPLSYAKYVVSSLQSLQELFDAQEVARSRASV